MKAKRAYFCLLPFPRHQIGSTLCSTTHIDAHLTRRPTPETSAIFSLQRSTVLIHVHEWYRRTTTSQARESVLAYKMILICHNFTREQLCAPAMLFFCGTHHVSQIQWTPSCSMRSSFTRRTDQLNSSAPCAWSLLFGIAAKPAIL